MKNLTNILSYLWLLLLMAVTACSDLEEEVGPMHVEEEVELNIQLHVPDMQASTREEMVITENISSIVAIAFDESGALIKKVDAILSDQDHENHNGTLKIKVPIRTQTIHFLGNYTKNDIEEESITSLETLNNFTTTDATTMPTMRYWGMTTFDDSNINQPVTLYRNMAKLTLKTGDGFTPKSCYIAGFVNRNISGTIVPGGHAVGDTPTIPNNVEQRDYTDDNELGNVYYLFEHANVENNNPLYVIIEVDDKYYKIAFASGDTYFPILRNCAYEITVTEPLDEMYAEANYPAAVNSQYPINDLVITSVPMTVTASPTEVLNQSGQTFTVTVTIPEGITELNVPTHDAFDITPPNSLTPQNGKYTVTQGNYEFKFTVKPDVEAGNKTISFSGRGKYKSATGSATVNLYEIENVDLPITPDAPTVGNTKGCTTQLTVQIPDGITSLTITTDAFDVATPEGVTLENGTYNVSSKQGQSITFTLTLKANGTANETKTVTFTGSGQKKTATGTATVTLQDNALANVNLTVAVIDEDANNPSMVYGQNSEEDLYVKVTIPAGVTTLAFSSEYFDIASASDLMKEGDGGKAYLSGSGNSYTVNHQGEESITLPFRLRLKNGVQNTPATFTFTGTGVTINETSVTKNVTLQQRNPDDGSVYWEGYLPLNQSDNTTKISIPKSALTVGRVMRIECEKTQDNQALALLNNWNQFNPDMQYSTATIDVPLTQAFVNSINDNDNLIITGRGAAGMLMKKVSFLQLQTVPITAVPAVKSLDYSTNSVSDLIVNVTIPKEVSTLTFDSEYFDAKVVGQSISLNNGGYAITHGDNAESTTVTVRLRLKDDKKIDTNAGFTFSGTTTNGDVTVIPAVVSDIDLNPDGDEYVRWQGYAALEWGKNPAQIPFPYSWFQSLAPGSILRVEYEVNGGNNPTIQFTEVKTQNWTGNPYYFGELGDSQGVNLDNNTSPSITTTTTRDLILTSTILNKMNENLNSILGETNVALAIQGGGAILKKVSILPNNNYVENGYPVWSGSMQLNQNPYVNTYLLVGTEVTLYFGSNANGGTINVQDYNGTQLVNNANASNGSYKFTISNNAANGLNINGSNLTLSSVVLNFPVINSGTEIFTRNFDENINVDCWNNSGGQITATPATEVDGRKVLSIANTPGNNDPSESSSQVAIDGDFVPGNYTLTYKIKGSANGSIQQGFQHTYSRDGNKYKDASKFIDVSFTTNWNDNVSVTLTIDKPCNRFLLNFGKYEGTIYIDDLRLVKN